MSGSPGPGGGAPALSARQRWQIAGLTAAAFGLWLLLHFLPGRSALSPMDFVVGGSDALQFCDPNRPQFLPVLARSSPVVIGFVPGSPARLTLQTVSGKPIGPADLALTDGVPLRLFLVDRAMTQFYSVRPVPGLRAGEWLVAANLRGPARFRAFVDLTPAAIGRELYASCDWDQAGVPAAGGEPANGAAGRVHLRSSPAPIYARRAAALTLTFEGSGGPPLAPTWAAGGRAEVVLFDEETTGMVRLRSAAMGGMPADAAGLAARFSVTFPDPGRYLLWAELTEGGHLTSARFALQVFP